MNFVFDVSFAAMGGHNRSGSRSDGLRARTVNGKQNGGMTTTHRTSCWPRLASNDKARALSSGGRGLAATETDTRLSSICEPCAPEGYHSACLTKPRPRFDFQAAVFRCRAGTIEPRSHAVGHRLPRARGSCRSHRPAAMSRQLFGMARAFVRRRSPLARIHSSGHHFPLQ